MKARLCCLADSVTFLPARLGDDHLCSDVAEPLPELRLLQGHPDGALQVGVRTSGHGGGRGASEARLHVWKQRGTMSAWFS